MIKIDLTYDVIFKAVFNKRKDVLGYIIKDILDIKEYDKPITIIGYETVPYKDSKRIFRCDLLIKLSDKSYVELEINRRKSNDIIVRNTIELVRIHNQIIEEGESDKDLVKYSMYGLNWNKFNNENDETIVNYAICNTITGKIATDIYKFCLIDLEKCKKMVYNVDNLRLLPKGVRWGAIIGSNSLEEIEYILGDDMLTMEEKKKFIKTIKEVHTKEDILEDWMIDQHARWKYEDEMNTARKDGFEQGIEQGIEQGANTSKIEIISNMLKEKLIMKLYLK